MVNYQEIYKEFETLPRSDQITKYLDNLGSRQSEELGREELYLAYRVVELLQSNIDRMPSETKAFHNEGLQSSCDMVSSSRRAVDAIKTSGSYESPLGRDVLQKIESFQQSLSNLEVSLKGIGRNPIDEDDKTRLLELIDGVITAAGGIRNEVNADCHVRGQVQGLFSKRK